METKVFTFELMRPDRLMVRENGSTGTTSLDEILADGWEPLHWENVSEQNFVRYRAIMARRKGAERGLSWGSVPNRR